MNEGTALQELKAFLNKLFQFESQDLDFGIYKILHHKRKEIKTFIDELLTTRVTDQLRTLDNDEIKQADEELIDLRQKPSIQNWLKAKSNNDTVRLEIYEEDYRADLARYREIERMIKAARAAHDNENVIYNHLCQFFSRYYDKGDFVSKRRFGKNEKYIVPYNGEETHFYWANHDQYYIKSSEHFQKYSFKVAHSSGNLIVNFKLQSAETPQGNVKANDSRYFILATTPTELQGEELNIFFEFRPLREDETKGLDKGGKQDQLNAQAAATIQKNWNSQAITHKLWEAKGEESTLLYHLQQYSRKNKYDFFIHKDLKGFLRRELDFYIKSELVAVDDLYVLESDIHFDRVRQSFRMIKAFKNIADTIIDFLTQLEEFQKKLWEKKKFVLRTDWVITVDRMVAWLGEEKATPFLKEVLANVLQIQEWEQLFGKKTLPSISKGKPDVHVLKNNLLGWMKLPIDTAHFSTEFKWRLLGALSEVIDLEEEAGGLVLHSDNYHGLMELQEKYREAVNCIYIDPPYNTAASEILYKNSFKNSSWMTLIENRLNACLPILQVDGHFCATIDDFQQRELSFLIEKSFSKDGMAGTVIIRNNPSGRPTQTGFALAHEYGIFARKSKDALIGRIERTDDQQARFNEEDGQGNFEVRNLRREGSNSERIRRPKLYYPFFVQESQYRIPAVEWDNVKRSWEILEEPTENEVIIWPIDDNNIERTWRWGIEKVVGNTTEVFVKKVRGGRVGLYLKVRPNGNGAVTPTVWTDSKFSATEHGTGWLKKLFVNPVFTYPKSVYAVEESLGIMGLRNNDGLALDFFAGSGTTFHATQLLNKEDNGDRKCILIEQGGYVYTVILPRIKKIAYTFDWKDGLPKDDKMNGLGIFFKYQRLEQYEEALENIAFNAPAEAIQQALTFDGYLPKYFLEFETRDSKTLVNTSEMADPWDYKLRVWDGFTYDTEQAVDLLETFNYLIGLHMHKCITREVAGKRYQFVYGVCNGSNRKALVVWRNVKDWDLASFEADGKYLRETLKDWEYDELYINGQAHLEGYQTTESVFKSKMIP